MMVKDIETRDDILKLVTKFYEKLLADKSISYLFTDVAKINMDHHIPVLVDFWDSVLFQSDTYRKNAMQPHLALHDKSPLQPHHFETWLGYFKQTIDENFEGEKAFLAKEKAISIATIMKIKLKQTG
jgi:hemoglobin